MHIRHLPCKTQGLLIPKEDIPPNHSMFNPSADGPYIYVRANRRNRTEECNFAVIYDERTKNTKTIESPMQMLKPCVNLFQGIEDLRIVVFQDRIWFSGTTTHASYKMTNELIVGHFDKNLTKVEKMSVVDIGSLPVKNVCPFVYKNTLCLLDAYKRKVYEVQTDEDTGEFVATCIKELCNGLGITDKSYRGSTSPVHLHGNTWGFVVHDIIFNDNLQLVTRLAYYHHWVEVDIERGMITYVSPPFWVMHWGIEYVSGIRYKKESGEVELFLGIEDSMPVRAVTTVHDLRTGK